MSGAERDFEEVVKRCYSTWGPGYYDEYYGSKAAYPPVHREILKALLSPADVVRILDAGCGPASFLREMHGQGKQLYGFDLTPEMVAEGQRVMAGLGEPAGRVWQGSVLDAAAYRAPDGSGAFDAAICFGVLPHLTADAEAATLRHLRDAVVPGGLVAVQARNQLFALFSLNRYSHEFFRDELIRPDALAPLAGPDGAAGLDAALQQLAGMFRLDLPPVRQGKAGEPGYDEVLSRTHNPFLLRRALEELGFAGVRVLFHHFHALPPMLNGHVPELVRRASLAMEDPTDWRGYFMASSFVVVGTRPAA